MVDAEKVKVLLTDQAEDALKLLEATEKRVNHTKGKFFQKLELQTKRNRRRNERVSKSMFGPTNTPTLELNSVDVSVVPPMITADVVENINVILEEDPLVIFAKSINHPDVDSIEKLTNEDLKKYLEISEVGEAVLDTDEEVEVEELDVDVAEDKLFDEIPEVGNVI